MRRKILLVPVLLAGILALLTWGCEKEDKDVCEKFEPQNCEIANSCCPTDGGNCYYEYGDQKFYCDKSKATTGDPDGCNDAESQVIALICSAHSPEQLMVVKSELRQLTQKLLREARAYSVCH